VTPASLVTLCTLCVAEYDVIQLQSEFLRHPGVLQHGSLDAGTRESRVEVCVNRAPHSLQCQSNIDEVIGGPTTLCALCGESCVGGGVARQRERIEREG
jgi:hypothetical protein